MQAPIVLLGPLFLLFLLALALGLVAIILSLCARRRVTHPACGSCGYAVEGLEALRCPECGSDLRAVGIVTPDMARGLKPGVLALLLALVWTLLLPLPASVVTRLVSSAMPWRYENSILVTLGPGPSASFTGAEVFFTGKGRSPATGYDSANAFLVRADGSKSLPFVVDLVEQTCTFIDPETKKEGPERPISSTLAEDWMKAEGADQDATLAKMQSTELISIIASVPATNMARTQGGFSNVSMSSTSVFKTVTWFMPAALAAWGLIWLGGLFFIYRRYRRRKRARS